jgi:acetyl-CoA acyltransferase
MSKEVFIVDGIRTPIGSLSGALRNVRADDMGAHVLKSLMERNPKLDPSLVEDVIFGCANQAGEDNRNVARMSLLLAGLPLTIGGETVNRLCASGMAATINASRAIKDGAGEIYISGGVEQMTRAPWIMSKSANAFGRDMQLADSTFGWRFINPQMETLYGVDSMGMTAENLALKYDISRENQDQFALWSQQKFAAARENGFFNDEIVPVIIPQKKGPAIVVDQDEFPRPSTTFETLAGLRPAFTKTGTVTAGNSSGLNDGAAALLLASSEACIKQGLTPLARIVAASVAGVEPSIMGIGPVKATQKVLERAGLSLDQMDLIEINEAFSAQVLACLKELNIASDDQRVNPTGGAIALGHPLGMSGARILLSAARQLTITKKRYALVTMCIGVGQGYAVILERA